LNIELYKDVVFASKEDGHGRMHDLDTVSSVYRVTFIDMIEFYRNPRTGRDHDNSTH
jgi:hypothetical protein